MDAHEVATRQRQELERTSQLLDRNLRTFDINAPRRPYTNRNISLASDAMPNTTATERVHVSNLNIYDVSHGQSDHQKLLGRMRNPSNHMFSLTTADIQDHVVHQSHPTSKRSSNPLAPDYDWPTYTAPPAPQDRFIRDQIDVSDIVGAHAGSGQPKWIRGDPMRKYDEVQGGHPTQRHVARARSPPPPVDSHRFRTTRHSNPLDPEYVMGPSMLASYLYGADPAGERQTIGPISGAVPTRTYNAAQRPRTPGTLKTADIDGAQPITKERRFARPARVPFSLRTDDIDGGRANTVKSMFLRRTHRHVNPQDPQYVYPGTADPQAALEKLPGMTLQPRISKKPRPRQQTEAQSTMTAAASSSTQPPVAVAAAPAAAASENVAPAVETSSTSQAQGPPQEEQAAPANDGSTTGGDRVEKVPTPTPGTAPNSRPASRASSRHGSHAHSDTHSRQGSNASAASRPHSRRSSAALSAASNMMIAPQSSAGAGSSNSNSNRGGTYSRVRVRTTGAVPGLGPPQSNSSARLSAMDAQMPEPRGDFSKSLKEIRQQHLQNSVLGNTIPALSRSSRAIVERRYQRESHVTPVYYHQKARAEARARDVQLVKSLPEFV